MMQAFTRNYEDNSTEAGFQFTFFCDICNDGYRSQFIESSTYKKSSGIRGIGRGLSVLGDLVGGSVRNLTSGIERGSDILSERFEDRSPQWQREHEAAFLAAQQEARQHFHRCHACQKWVCSADFNEEEGLCIECAPRQDIYVARTRAEAMRRNIDEAGEAATVWTGSIESKTTVCPVCGKPAGSGKFCNNCGAPMGRVPCPACGALMAPGVRFCNNCGASMTAPRDVTCPGCGAKLEPGVRFCGSCGTRL